VEELEQNVTKTLEKKYGKIGTAGSTNSSGKVEIKSDPNPYTREATVRHERVHQQTVEAGIAKYGKDTPGGWQALSREARRGVPHPVVFRVRVLTFSFR